MKKIKIIKHIINWLKKYIKKSNSKGFIIGISGGIDSTVTSILVAMTKLPTIILDMPIKKEDNILSEKHAKLMIDKYPNVNYLKKNLNDIFYTFYYTLIKKDNKIINDKKQLAIANIKARIRMITLYYYANIYDYIVVGTGNKIEDFGVGFFTKYGDGGVDIQPISDLNKSEIRIIAKKLNVIPEIQNAEPNDGLWNDKRTDEQQLGATYEELEWAMNYNNDKFVLKKNINSISEREKNVLFIYNKFNKKNKHKIDPIPFCKIPQFFKN